MKKRTVLFCYINYMISGGVTLCFGAILPTLIEQIGMNYTQAAAIITCLTIGNFSGSFVYPMLCSRFPRKKVTVCMCLCYPVSLILFTLVRNVALIYVCALIIGINRGVVTITNNQNVNGATGNSHRAVNLLHACFAIGAVLSPLAIALFTAAGVDWKLQIRVIAALTAVIPVLYYFADFSETQVKQEKSGTANERSGVPAFFRNECFWLAGVMIFCYMGLENMVNGLFATYLKDRGLMSETLSTMLVSLIWAMMLVGRLIVASVSGRLKKCTVIMITSCIQLAAVTIMIFSDNRIVVVVALMLLGLGLSGISPTLYAYNGVVADNATLGISLTSGMCSFGGLVLPQLIGIVADRSGFGSAILLMEVFSVALVMFAAILIPKTKKHNVE